MEKSLQQSWARVDLRHRVEELVEAKEIVIQGGKKSGTPLQKAITELNKASRKKADLVHHAQTNLLITVGPNATIPVIQKAAMEKLLNEIAGEDGDLMGFGKFSNRTYLDVKLNEPKYCEWAKTVYQEESTSVYLKRFVQYLLQTPASENKKIPIKVSPQKTGPKQGYKEETVKQEMTAPPPGSSTAASSSTEAAVNQLAQIAGTLINEAKDLKEERAAAVPRKVAAVPEVKMDSPRKDSRSAR